MGLLQGTMSMRAYRVEGDLPKRYREDFLEAVKKHAFRELSGEKDFAHGWVKAENLLDVDFDDQNLFRNQYLTLSLRVDKKAVNARLFRALLEREIAKTLKGSGRERLKPSERKEIRERLQRQLLEKAEPARRTYDLCWDTQAGRLWFFATADKLQDLLRELFGKTFRMEPAMQTAKGRFEAASGGKLPPDLDDPGRELLSWIWWRTDQEGGRFTLPKSGEVFLWVEDRMLFKEPSEKPAVASLSGGDPARTPEARAAFAGGKRLSRVKLGMKRGEREWSFTLDGETLDVISLKMPTLLSEGEDERLFERLALLEEANFVLEELLGEFTAARLSDSWERKEQAAIARWVAEGAPAGAIVGGARRVAAAAPHPRKGTKGKTARPIPLKRRRA